MYKIGDLLIGTTKGFLYRESKCLLQYIKEDKSGIIVRILSTDDFNTKHIVGIESWWDLNLIICKVDLDVDTAKNSISDILRILHI